MATSKGITHHTGYDGTVFSTVEDQIELLRTLRGTLVGMVVDYGGAAAPSLWLLCYGQAISRTTYAALFTVLGTTYGVGDGSTTFNLPDCRGRVVAGQDDMGGPSANRLTNQTGGLDGDTLGATGGAETHTLLQTHLPNVNFTVTDNRTWAFKTSNTAAGSDTVNASSASSGVTNNTPAVTVTGAAPTAASGGSGTAVNNVQPTLILNKMIYTGVA